MYLLNIDNYGDLLFGKKGLFNHVKSTLDCTTANLKNFMVFIHEDDITEEEHSALQDKLGSDYYLNQSRQDPSFLAVPMAVFLFLLATRGITIRIVCTSISGQSDGNSTGFHALAQDLNLYEHEHVTIIKHPHNHAKLFIFDGLHAVAGSGNLTGAAVGTRKIENKNYEIGFYFQKGAEPDSTEADLCVVDALKIEFERIFSAAEAHSLTSD